MKITWVTATTGRAYVNGDFVGYAHKKKTELCITIPSSNFISEKLHNNSKQGKMQPYSL